MTPQPEIPTVATRADADPLETSRITARLNDGEHRKPGLDPLLQVRSSDLEPYTGLGYLSRLFRLIAILLLLLLVAEVGVGLYSEGAGSLRTLLTEASRLLVVAGVLWGAGDLATLLIDIGHDVRATRILLGRQAVHGDHPLPPLVPINRREERRSARRGRDEAAGKTTPVG